MYRKSLMVRLVLVSVLAGAAVFVVAQDKQPQMTPEQQKMMEEWMKIASPGEHHKHLDYFVGTWDVVTKMWMEPGTPPAESKGVSKSKWVLDGRFIQDDYTGEMMGMPYKGLGLTGYDNYRNLYVGSWFSNMGTNVLTFSGTRSQDGKSITFYGEMDEPALRMTGRTVKYVNTILGPDNWRFEIIDLAAGDNYKVIEMNYTRRK